MSLVANFGPFHLDAAQARLQRAGAPVPLLPKDLDVLCFLVRHAGKLVSKDELLDAVWGHRHVTESVLKSVVSRLRAALGDDAKAPTYIETVPRRGYRFVAALQTPMQPPRQAAAPQGELPPDLAQRLGDGRPVSLTAAALDLLAALVENRHRVVAREELFDRVWAGRVVEDQNLRQQVNALREVLGEAAIATLPGRGYRFMLPLADDERAAALEATAPALPVPEQPLLYGRVAEIGTTCRLVDEHRLVTLVGAGGVGKTQLARAVAHQLRPRFAGGAWMVELAALSDPAGLLPTLAQALALPGSPDQATMASVARALRDQHALLVVDNCEHMAGAVAALAEAVLAGAPRLHLLATSQEALRAVGEQVFRLEPLAVPPPGNTRPLQDFGAAALLLARVRAADARFALDPSDSEAVAEICRQLDGIPLALELAATRVPLLGIQGVRRRLGERLQWLRGGARHAPARQRTLRSALEWSVGLLAPDEKTALACLGTFAGSFDTSDGQHVIAGACSCDTWQALDLLAALFDKSLVQPVPPAGEGARYRLLESTRAYALELLAASGGEAQARVLHAQAMRARVEAADARYLATPSDQWLEALMPDIDNVREAFRKAQAAGERELAAALAAASAGLWNLSGVAREGVAMCRAAPADAGFAPRVLARLALATAQHGAVGVGDITAGEALAAARRAVDGYRALGDALYTYWSIHFMIPLAERAGEPLDTDAALASMRALEQPDWPPLVLRLRRAAEARRFGRQGDWAAYGDAFRDEARRLAGLGEHRGSWFAAQAQALAELVLGRPQETVSTLRPVVAQIRAAGRLRQTWTPLGLLAAGLIEAGALDEAALALRELMPLMQAEGSAAWGIDHASLFLVARGAWKEAALAHGWSDAATAGRREQRGPGIREAHARVAAALRQHFGEAALAPLLARGAAMGEDDVAALVIAFTPAPELAHGA